MKWARAPAAPRLIAARTAVPEQRIEQRVVAVRSERMHVHAGRLVADEHVVVFVANNER